MPPLVSILIKVLLAPLGPVQKYFFDFNRAVVHCNEAQNLVLCCSFCFVLSWCTKYRVSFFIINMSDGKSFKPRPFKFLLQHQCTSIPQFDEILTIYTFFNQSQNSRHTKNFNAVMLQVERNLILTLYARTPVQQRELRWSQLYC